ncbi:MAG: penicillin-binding protein 2 [Bacteroidota bacterium]
MHDYSDRKYVILAIFLTIGIIFLIRLFYIQIIDDRYKLSADNNVIRYITQYPARGLIYDRNGKLLVYNQFAYDLMVIPRQVKEIDTIDFCHLLDITKAQFIDNFTKAKKYSRYKPSVFQKQLSAETYAVFQEKLYNFPGFFVQPRTLRKYPQNIAAHLLGYVSEVNNRVIEKDNYYKAGDYIGNSGIEKSYEKKLRGKKGVKVFVVDVFNRIKGSFSKGKYDSLAVPGIDLVSTLDADLQAYGELLMQNKKGSIVAIEPSTGDILALVTSPGYDPDLLVGRVRSSNYKALEKDTLIPLFNRALMAQYPPGSTFKIIQALIGLQERVIFPNTMFSCNKFLVNCHNHRSPLNLHESIQYSCNPYYYMVFKRIIYQGKNDNKYKNSEAGFNTWREHVLSFGLGNKLGIDISAEKGGNVPTVNYYNKIYGNGRWKFETVYSLGIGQGEILLVPLQMANFAAIIANRGYYYTPHLINEGTMDERQHYPAEYREGTKEGKDKPSSFGKHQTTINPEYFDLIVDAMQDVVENGTARRARIDSITVCGKTGTAENPHGEDHSIFIAFAPKDNPKIAISVVVENSGFGGTWAAPIASLMIEKYLTNNIGRPEDEKRILEEDFINQRITK